jgi:DNA-binding NarL/FixJ family response regulator
MKDKIRVLIVDDQLSARKGLRALLQTWPDLDVIGEAEDSEAAFQQATDLQPDVVVMDVKIPYCAFSPTHNSDLGGIRATQHIKATLPDTAVLMLTMFGTHREAAFAAGADGFLLKGGDPAKLVAEIERCACKGAPDRCSAGA